MNDEPAAERLGRWTRLGIGLVIVVGGGCAAAVVGAFVGIFICCAQWPDSNLAGLVGIFYGFPIGFAVGAVGGLLAVAFWVSRTS